MNDRELKKTQDKLYHKRISQKMIAEKSGKTPSAVCKYFAGTLHSEAIKQAIKELLEG
jgi:hypothetical protein